MEVTTNGECEQTILPQPRCPAYDPNNLPAEDEEARRYDDTSEGIDWDEIIATTQSDFEAGRFSYNSADYATQEEADAALRAWFDAIVAKVEHEVAPVPPHDGRCMLTS